MAVELMFGMPDVAGVASVLRCKATPDSYAVIRCCTNTNKMGAALIGRALFCLTHTFLEEEGVCSITFCRLAL